MNTHLNYTNLLRFLEMTETLSYFQNDTQSLKMTCSPLRFLLLFYFYYAYRITSLVNKNII